MKIEDFFMLWFVITSYQHLKHQCFHLDLFHFGQLDLDLFHETDPGSKKSAKNMENIHKNQTKSEEYHIFFTSIKLLFNGHKYLSHTINFVEKYIFDRNKSF